MRGWRNQIGEPVEVIPRPAFTIAQTHEVVKVTLVVEVLHAPILGCVCLAVSLVDHWASPYHYGPQFLKGLGGEQHRESHVVQADQEGNSEGSIVL
jgi:hypothetical protein